MFLYIAPDIIKPRETCVVRCFMQKNMANTAFTNAKAI